MRLSRSWVLALALACGCGGGEDGDGQPAGDGGPDDGVDADPDSTGAPGEVDHGFGVDGALHTEWRIVAVGARDSGEALLATSEYPALVTSDGELAAVDDTWVSSGAARILPDDDGGWYALHADPYNSALSAVVRLTPTLSLDEGFDGAGHFATTGAIDMTRAADGSFFVLGWLADDRLAVRKLDAGGAHDPAYGPEDADQATSPAEHPLDFPVALATTATGEVVALASDGFLPTLVRFTAEGELDESFGGGVVVLDGFGPRNGRDVVIDDQGRMLVLGMVNSVIQVGRVLTDGSLDPTFGDAGIAAVTVTMPLSSDYDEHVEARALALQPDGSIVVAASYEYDLGEDDVLEEESVLVARLLPDGALDDGFGTGGTVRVSLDAAGSPSQIADTRALAIAGDRILVGGHVTLAGGEEEGAVRALHR